MGSSAVIRSFSGGVITPLLNGRADLAKYQSGVAKAQNFYVQKEGVASNRPGTEFVSLVSTVAGEKTGKPFIFSDDEAYFLEFGHKYMRVFQDGAHVTEDAQAIVSATNTNPVVVNVATHGYSTGDEVIIDGVVGMYELNGRKFTITKLTASTFELDGEDGTGYGAYSSGGTASKVFVLDTPWLESDIRQIKTAQSLDVLFVVHPDYPPQEITRVAPNNWTVAPIEFAPLIGRPTTVAAAGSAGAVLQKYQVTAIDRDTLEESFVGKEAAGYAITGITQANPAVVSAGGHNFSTGDLVTLEGVLGMTEVNKREFIVGATTGATFELRDEDTTDFTTYTGAGTAYRLSAETTSAAASSGAPVTVTWTDVTNAVDYNVYKYSDGVYGFIGATSTTTFADTGQTVQITSQPPIILEQFIHPETYPAVVGLMQQRLWLGGASRDRELIYASQIDRFRNFSRSVPIDDGSALSFKLADEGFHEVRWFFEQGRPFIGTAGGAWALFGNDSGTVTPSSINARLQESSGFSPTLPPLRVQGSTVFVQARGLIIRDIARASGESERFLGKDLSIFASHLFNEGGFSIDSWTYQENPHSIVWAATNNGLVYGLTYVPDQDIYAWHTHLFTPNGRITDIVSIPEGESDSVYCIVNRGLDKYIERFNMRRISNPSQRTDLRYLDSYQVYDGLQLTLAGYSETATMKITTGTDYDQGEPLTLTANEDTFKSTDVGRCVVFDENSSTRTVCTIISYTSTKVVTATADVDIDTSLQATAVDKWCLGAKTLINLDHMDGQTVGVLADGYVLAQQLVSGGTITLDDCYCHIIVGFPYTADLQTLDLDNAQGETIVDKNALINHATYLVRNTRGGQVGTDFDSLEPIPQSEDNNAYILPPPLTTGRFRVNLDARWGVEKQVVWRQVDPLPVTILAIAPHAEVGG